MQKQLSVRLYGQPVGVLKQLISGKMEFTYDASAKQALSLSMPLGTEPYSDLHCQAFFGGLLPEGDDVRRILGKRYGISAKNDFALLRVIGYDCAGAVSLHEIEEPINTNSAFPLEGEILSEAKLYEYIQILPQNPLFLGLDDLRLSLAGAQDKAAVCLIDGKIALPLNGCPSTHILKPAISVFNGIAMNEYFCMRIAARVGLSVPAVMLHRIKDIDYLLIERYDRSIKNNQIARIHQEDFCQALRVPSNNKYQSDGGPGFKDCFNLLNKTTQPARNRQHLAAALVFNFLCCNMDAHGKNFSLLHYDSSRCELAPLYDIQCTSVYPTLTKQMAMKIGSKKKYDEVLPRHWEQLCQDIQYSYPALKKLIKKQGEAILEAMIIEKALLELAEGSESIIDEIIVLLKRHIEKTLNTFK